MEKELKKKRYYGPRTGSEHYKIKQLKIGEELVILDRNSPSVCGTISRYFPPEKFTVRQILIVNVVLETRKATLIQRIS